METDVLIIGGGVTGTGIARDLALRGIHSVLVEKTDINAGASGGNHGLLHSGARYVSSDLDSAVECMEESAVLRKIAPHCIDDCGGLFVAVAGDDEDYIRRFPDLCRQGGLPCTALTPDEAREREPSLSDRVIAAFAVEDASVDPFMLSLENMAHAGQLGSALRLHTRLDRFVLEGGRIKAVDLTDTRTGESLRVHPMMVINAAGAWSGRVAAMAGISLDVLCSMGTLLVTDSRMTHGVINRLRPPSDGDIIVPGGTVSIAGTTSIRIKDPDRCRPTADEADLIVEEGAALVPALASTRFIRAYAGVRPLVSAGSGAGGETDRSVSRGFALLDHTGEGVDNFITITGGKLTTFRLMAERCSDLACRKLGRGDVCRTRTEPLPSTAEGRWTDPGRAPRRWMSRTINEKDKLLCECEMISQQTIDEIAAELRQRGEEPDLLNIGKRSRLGKGPCQGAFCSIRVLAHMYDTGQLKDRGGLVGIRNFLCERWKGQRPIFWGDQLVQAELTEAIHCGFFDLERLGR